MHTAGRACSRTSICDRGRAVFALYALLSPSYAFFFLVDGVFFFFFCQNRVKLSMSSCESMSVCLPVCTAVVGLVCFDESLDGLVPCIEGVQIFIADITFTMLLICRVCARMSCHSSGLVSLYLC